MNLIVVESPTKAKTLSKFLGSGFSVLATMGHIRDLPERKIGIKIVKSGEPPAYKFTPEYVLMPKKQEAIEALQAAAKKATKIYLATDPDREGEAIAWHAAQILREMENGKWRMENGKKKKLSIAKQQAPLILNSQFSIPNIVRITFHEITKTAIEKALANPGQIDRQLVDAQQGRRILDRLVGYKLSPLLWFKIRRGLSAGRVQSVAVRLIVEREREIDKFVPVEYWEIAAELRRHIGGLKEGVPTFLAQLTKINGQTAKITSQDEASPVISELKEAAYEVGLVDKKEAFQSPVPPFTTSTLQQRAVGKLGFSSKRTMRAAQGLYEKGLITYHRTDSLNMATEAVEAIRLYINKVYGERYLPSSARFYKTKSKVAQEAHEAIRPTDVELKIENLKLEIGADEMKLYELIWRRTVACQMAPAIWDQTKIEVRAAGSKNIYVLTAEGKIIKFDGWLKAYGDTAHATSNTTENQLPELKQSDDLDLVKLDPEQKFTAPPARYNEASLIKTLEELGIGRPSTYAPIVSTIQDRQYVEKLEGRFQPTSLGITVNDFLMEHFPDVFDYQFTAKMEDELDDIARGKRLWQPVVADFWGPFEQKLTSVFKVAERVAVPVEVTGESCPLCKEGQLVIRVGRFGKFISCSRFPACKYTAPFAQKLEGVKCPKCGGDVVIKKSKKSKQFYGCSNYPKCDWASWRKPK